MLQSGVVGNELGGGQEPVHGLLFGDQGDAAVHGRIGTWIDSQDGHLALRGSDQPGHDPEQGRLAGAVGSQQAGHSRSELGAHLGDRHLLPEPARHTLEGHGGGGRAGRHDSLR